MAIIKQNGSNLGKGIKIGSAGLAARAQKFELGKTAGDTKPNRIALMLDCSGSMAGQSIEDLKIAVHGFIANCSWNDTSIAIRSFPNQATTLPLVSEPALLMMESAKLEANGGTPMFECLDNTIKEVSVTRGVIVSDGDATDLDGSYDDDGKYHRADVGKRLGAWLESKTPIDTVHIGDSTQGESTLKQISELTGGVFLKFKDTSQFSQAFKYLTPGFRAMLMAPGAAEAIGADEIKR